MVYQKTDKTIIHYELNYDQTLYPSYKVKLKSGLEYEFKVGKGAVYFDFYKKDNKYLPSLSGTNGFSYCTYNGKQEKNSFITEIIFQSFSHSSRSDLANRMDFGKRIWENLSGKKENNNDVLLSEVEKKFLYEK